MNAVKIDRSRMKLVDQLFNRGYVIADGRETKQIARALKAASIPIQNGYVQGSKKVILALEEPIITKIKMKTLKSVFFELEL